jgi:hypothetical protein
MDGGSFTLPIYSGEETLFDFMCGKRLAIVLRTTADTLVENGELKVSSEVRRKLLRISPATVDRLLAGEHFTETEAA